MHISLVSILAGVVGLSLTLGFIMSVGVTLAASALWLIALVAFITACCLIVRGDIDFYL